MKYKIERDWGQMAKILGRKSNICRCKQLWKTKHYVLDMFPYPSRPSRGTSFRVYCFWCVCNIKDIKVLMYCTDGLWQFWIAGWTIRHSNWTTSEDTTSVNIDGGFDKEGNKIAGYRKQLDKIGFSIGAESENFKSDYYNIPNGFYSVI
jgi:leucyl-tRNA synthetase